MTRGTQPLFPMYTYLLFTLFSYTHRYTRITEPKPPLFPLHRRHPPGIARLHASGCQTPLNEYSFNPFEPTIILKELKLIFIIIIELTHSIKKINLSKRNEIIREQKNMWLLSIAHNKISIKETSLWFR